MFWGVKCGIEWVGDPVWCSVMGSNIVYFLGDPVWYLVWVGSSVVFIEGKGPVWCLVRGGSHVGFCGGPWCVRWGGIQSGV